MPTRRSSQCAIIFKAAPTSGTRSSPPNLQAVARLNGSRVRITRVARRGITESDVSSGRVSVFQNPRRMALPNPSALPTAGFPADDAPTDPRPWWERHPLEPERKEEPEEEPKRGSPNGRSPDGRSPDGRSPDGRSPDGRSPRRTTRRRARAVLGRDVPTAVQRHRNRAGDQPVPHAVPALSQRTATRRRTWSFPTKTGSASTWH